jgi:sugar phosphate isomerase/epimerase
VLGVGFRDERWKDAAYLNDLAALARDKGVELRMSQGGNFHLRGDELDAVIERSATIVNTVASHTDIRFSSTACGPMSYNRWTAAPPLAERLEVLPQNLGKFADAVASSGVTIALENHCDYRGHEIASIVQRANRPNLRVQIDTGNAFSVFEEPVDCAQALAPYTVSAHLKDIIVIPFSPPPTFGSRALTAPLGAGHVDNVAICQILQANAPNPDQIALMIEPFYTPQDMTADAFLEQSVAWARVHLAPYLH